MKALRRLALAALAIAFLQIVFGAIARITALGSGCGDGWPRCLGQWAPPTDRPDLVVEVASRYLALLLLVPLAALVLVAWTRRGRQAGVTGPGGVLRAALLALGLYLLIANVGGVGVEAGAVPYLVALQEVLAMALLATLAAAVVRTGGLGALAADRQKIVRPTRGASLGAAALALAVVALGALTAYVPGAAQGCLGFPACSQAYVPTNGAAHLQLTHRVLAALLLLHLAGMALAARRRREVGAVTTAGHVALGVVTLQIVLAAVLVTTGLPRALQSVHQALGTLAWLATFLFAVLARRAIVRDPSVETTGEREAREKGEGSTPRVRVPARAPSRTPASVVASAPSPTVAFVATTGPNARMVRVDPNDDAGFAAAEAGVEAFPPPEEPQPDVPALAETGSWSLADLSIGLPPNADEHVRSDDPRSPARPDDPTPAPLEPRGPRDEQKDDRGGHGGHSGHGPTSLAAPFVAAALLAAPHEAQASSAESHEAVTPRDVPAIVAVAVAPAFAPYTAEVEPPPVAASEPVVEAPPPVPPAPAAAPDEIAALGEPVAAPDAIVAVEEPVATPDEAVALEEPVEADEARIVVRDEDEPVASSGLELLEAPETFVDEALVADERMVNPPVEAPVAEAPVEEPAEAPVAEASAVEAPARRRPPSLAVIIARGAMS